MLKIVLLEPEIPPNTGNIIRLCANTGCALHLIGPMGFELDDKRLRRAGLDYHEFSEITEWDNWKDYLKANGLERTWAFSTHGSRHYPEAEFSTGDSLLFGAESRGLPSRLLQQLGPRQVLRLPMMPNSRSLNLSNTVAVAVYEALRQLKFPSLT